MTASSPLIREAVQNDAADIARLVQQHAALDMDPSALAAPYVATYLASANNAILVAELAERVVALLSYSLRPDLYHGGTVCLIEELIVDTHLRGQGIGSALVRELRRRLSGTDCTELGVAVESENEGGLRFYRSHGFQDEALLLEDHCLWNEE